MSRDHAADPRRHRVLLPAPPSSDKLMAANRSVPDQDARLHRSRRRNIQTACISCRQHKTRCDGAQPVCTSCLRRGFDCQYPDLSKSNVTKQKADEICGRLEGYDRLYHFLQAEEEETAVRVFRRIREGQTLDSILRYLDDDAPLPGKAIAPDTSSRKPRLCLGNMPSFLKLPDNLFFESDLFLLTMDMPRGQPHYAGGSQKTICDDSKGTCCWLYQSASVVDPRINSADVLQWTNVTTDAHLVRELLCIYFSFEHPVFNFFHKDYFLDDLVAGQGEHCSSLLVNAILATACHAHREAPLRGDFLRPDSLQYRFSAEARRLRELDLSADTLTAVQAAVIMSACCIADGIGQVGWSYLLQAQLIAEKAQLFQHSKSETSVRLRTAKAITAWAVFCWQSALCFHHFRRPLMEKPPPLFLTLPEQDCPLFTETWVQYPTSDKPISIQQSQYFQATRELHTLMNDIGVMAFPQAQNPERLSLRHAYSFYSQLKQWYARLPEPLSIGKATLPLHYLIHMQYFKTVTVLFETFTLTTASGVRTETSDVRKDLSPVSKIVQDSKAELYTILRLYYQNYG